MKPIIWDPEKSDHLIETIETILKLVETGELDSSSMRPVDLRNMAKVTGDIRLDRLANFFKKRRNSWATGDGDWLPNTEEDKTGWTGFVEKTLPYWSSNGTNFQSTKLNRDHYRHTKKEIGDIKTARDLYLSGDCTAEEARELIPGIDLTDSQMNIYFPKQTATEKKEEEIEKEVKEIEKKHEKEIDIEQRVTILEKKYNDTHKTTSLRKVKRRNPYFLLGDIYQNLIGAALRIAHLDDRVYEEVALTHKKENGKLIKTSNIVDYLVLEGYDINSKKIKKKEKIILYEIKLGRQTVGLEEQSNNQIKAAEDRYFDNIEHKLMLGTPLSWIPSDKLGGMEFREARKNYKENQRKKIIPPSIIFEKASETLNRKTQGMRESIVTSQLKQALKQSNYEEREKLIPQIERSEKFIDETVEATGGRFKSIVDQINLMLQLRNANLEQLNYFDTNIYLLNKYVSKRLKKDLRESILGRYDKMETNPIIRDLGSILEGMLLRTNFNVDKRKESLPVEELSEFHTTTTEISKEFAKTQNIVADYISHISLGYLGGKIKDVIVEDLEDLTKKMHGLNMIDFWGQYFIGGKNEVIRLLDAKDRNDIRYEEHGLQSEFSFGKRVIPRIKRKYSTIIKELSNFGIDLSYIDFNDKEQVKDFEENKLPEYITILEKYYNEMELFNKGSIESQRRKIKSNKEDLEAIVSVKGFSKKTNSGLNHFQHWMKEFELEDDILDIGAIDIQLSKDLKERKKAKVGKIFLNLRNYICSLLNISKKEDSSRYKVISGMEAYKSTISDITIGFRVETQELSERIIDILDHDSVYRRTNKEFKKINKPKITLKYLANLAKNHLLNLPLDINSRDDLKASFSPIFQPDGSHKLKVSFDGNYHKMDKESFIKEQKENKKVKKNNFRYLVYLHDFIMDNPISYESLEGTESKLVNYLKDNKKTKIIDQRHFKIYKDMRNDKKAISVMRSYLFEDTNTIENYLASKMLHLIDKTIKIKDFDTNIGQDYFNLARQELKTGKDHGSASLLKETIDYMNELSSSPEKIIDHYLNDNKKETK